MIIHGDCLEEMRKLASGAFRAVVTSPPYNLKSTTSRKTKSMWKRSPLMDGGYDGYDDAMPRSAYVEWQRECIAEMLRLTEPAGVVFYNHHWRVQGGLQEWPTDILEGFPVRQTIIWWRNGGINFNSGYFYPDYEMVFMLAHPDFRLANGANKTGSVWKIGAEMNNPHPAAFPVELARRCIDGAGSGPILDPFCGSGTTGVAAKILGFEFVGIEQSADYVKMANARLSEPVTPDFGFSE